jgi:hypothetical protein
MEFSDDLDSVAEELSESFLNGNIKIVMSELERLPVFKAMALALRISKLFRLDSTRISFERAINNRV